MIKLLIDHGAKLNYTTRWGHTALKSLIYQRRHDSEDRKEYVLLLIRYFIMRGCDTECSFDDEGDRCELLLATEYLKPVIE